MNTQFLSTAIFNALSQPSPTATQIFIEPDSFDNRGYFRNYSRPKKTRRKHNPAGSKLARKAGPERARIGGAAMNLLIRILAFAALSTAFLFAVASVYVPGVG